MSRFRFNNIVNICHHTVKMKYPDFAFPQAKRTFSLLQFTSLQMNDKTVQGKETYVILEQNQLTHRLLPVIQLLLKVEIFT